jgi:tRNA (Thr-GGU) A37 N-methylase
MLWRGQKDHARANQSGGMDGTRLSVVGLDCLDGMPLIDLKPYFASTDAVPDAVR